MLDANLLNTHRITKCKQITKNPECKKEMEQFFSILFFHSAFYFSFTFSVPGVL
jgi:hypothetical protein